MDVRQDTVDAVARVAPAIGGAWYSVMTLNDWVAVVTILYVLLQIGLLLPKYYRFLADRWGK